MRICKPRVIICTILAVLATTSVIGTGFCLWAFGKNPDSLNKKASLSIDVGSYTKVGAFVKDSLKTNGTIGEAEKNYIFPSMLVFEEGHGLEQDLTKGLNFFKKTHNLPDKPNYDSSLPIFEGQPFFSDKVDVHFFREMQLENTEDFKLEVSILVTSELCKAIAVLDQFQFSHSTIKKNVENAETGKIDIEFTYEFTKLCQVSTPTYKGSVIKPYVIQTENIQDNVDYRLYTYHFNLGEIFRYYSMDYKPTTVAAYKNLLEIIKNKNEKLQFTFRGLI